MPYVISRLFYFINVIESAVMIHNVFYRYDAEFGVSLPGRRSPMMPIDYIAGQIYLLVGALNEQ